MCEKEDGFTSRMMVYRVEDSVGRCSSIGGRTGKGTDRGGVEVGRERGGLLRRLVLRPGGTIVDRNGVD